MMRQTSAGGREQLRKQVQEELGVAEGRIAKLCEQIDVIILRSE